MTKKERVSKAFTRSLLDDSIEVNVAHKVPSNIRHVLREPSLSWTNLWADVGVRKIQVEGMLKFRLLDPQN